MKYGKPEYKRQNMANQKTTCWNALIDKICCKRYKHKTDTELKHIHINLRPIYEEKPYCKRSWRRMKGSDLLWIGVRCVTLPELLCQVCVTRPPTFPDGDDSNLPLCFSIHNWKPQLYIQPSPSRNYTYTTVHYIIHQSLGSIVAANSWLSATIIQSAPSTGLCVSTLAVYIHVQCTYIKIYIFLL